MKRIGTLVTAALAVFTLAFGLAPRAGAQDIVKAEAPTQTLTLKYPESDPVLSGAGDNAVTYRGLVHVSVFPISPLLKKQYGDDPIFSDEIRHPGGYGDDTKRPQLPLGKYEVDFSIRDGDDLKTCIRRPVILSLQNAPTVTADFSSAKTLVIGGDITFQEMENAVYGLSLEVKELKAQVAALKDKAGAAPAK